MTNVYKILVVDDSVNANQFMARTLLQAGYQVFTAFSGKEGFTKALYMIPDCILLDLVLPDTNGFEICRRLRAKDPNHRHKIVLVSSRNTSADYEWGWKQGADYYLPKPFTEEKLVQVIRYVLSPAFTRPDDSQELTLNLIAEDPKESVINWQTLIPYRKEEPAALTTANPFTSATIIEDKQARKMYGAIDNRRNMHELCVATGLTLQQAIEALRFLLTKDRIQLHDSNGKQVSSDQLFDAH